MNVAALSLQDQQKQAVAYAAIDYVKDGAIIGVGTGSTVAFFIDALIAQKHRIKGAVSSSEASSARLSAAGIPLFDLNSISTLSLYVDGADEVDPHQHLIKGGGAALTREKIVAAVAETFVCIVDQSKQVSVLGAFPLPIEVIPMARSHVMRELVKLGAHPVWRENVVTDNGHIILDVSGLQITDPVALEKTLNQIVGVVSNGLFAKRKADIVLTATATGVMRSG